MKTLVATVFGLGAVLVASAAFGAECDTTGRIDSGNATSLPSISLLATGLAGNDNCQLTGASNILPVSDTNKYVVYKVLSTGFHSQADGDVSTYTVTSNGQVKTYTKQGEAFDSFTIEQYYAAGLGPTYFDGDFQVDTDSGTATLELDALDFQVGFTSLTEQEDSFDLVGLQQLSLATHLGGVADLLTGGNLALEGADEVGVLGGRGSHTIGASGRYNIAEGFSVLGGVSLVDLGAPGASASGVHGAAALRYVEPRNSEFRLVGEAGLQASVLQLSFSRTYANGFNTTTASGSGSGALAAAYVRAGVLWQPTPDHDVLFSATLKHGSLGIGSLLEGDNPADPNFFAADYSGTATPMTTVKGSADWTAQLTSEVDLTASLGVGASFAAGASAKVFGIPGTVTGAAQTTIFAQYGARLGWMPTDKVTIDGFVQGTTGTGIGTHALVGAGARMQF